MRRLAALLVLSLPLLLLPTLVPEPAEARAGGGQGYSSGSSGGGGSSSWSGGSSSYSSSSSSHSRSRSGGTGRPMTGLELTILGGMALFMLIFRLAIALIEHRDRRRNLQRAARREASLAAGIAGRLHARDPAFDLDAFSTRVREGFLRLQHAWSEQDLDPVRPFLSDGVYERLSLQLAEQRERGVRNAMDEVQVRGARIVALESDERFDVLHVCFEASARDREVRLSDDQPVPGTEHSGPFTEYWSFLRQHAAKTPEGEGLFESRCPDCGAPVTASHCVHCSSCGAALRSGSHDWVLCEITQACEWAPSPRSVPGLAELQALDPAASRQHLEDRASVIFWRLVAASRQESLAEMRKLVAEDAPPLASLGRGSDVAVGGVFLRGIETRGDWEHALVLVKWSARFGGTSRDEAPLPRQSLLVLARRKGCRHDVGATLTSAHCNGCGASLDPGRGAACEHCGRVQNDGRAGWVLLEWAPVASQHGRALLASVAAPRRHDDGSQRILPAAVDLPVTTALLSWVAVLAQCDGRIDPRERAALERLAHRAGLGRAEAAKLLGDAQSGSLEPEPPLDDLEMRQWLISLASVATADGRPRSAERRLLERLARESGLAEFDARRALWKAWRES